MERFLIADDHPLFREAVTTIFERNFPEATVETASDLNSAVDLARNKGPYSLIMLDLDMPGMDGPEGVGRIKDVQSDVPIAIISGSLEKSKIKDSFDQGAKGYFPKTLESEVLTAAVKLVCAGGVYVPSDLLNGGEALSAMLHDNHIATPQSQGALIPTGKASSDGSIIQASLTSREMDVLRGIRQGQSNKEIARELDLQEVIIKLHVRRILKKLGAKNRVQAALVAQSVDV